MTGRRRPLPRRASSAAGWIFVVARMVAAGLVAARLARAARRRPPLTVAGTAPYEARAVAGATISVVIPARDEAERLAPLLDALAADAAQETGAGLGAVEIIAVDDESTDGTAALARSRGAQVVTGAPLPPGWVGKPWALDQGLRAAAGDWIVTLDADVEPAPGLLRALVRRTAADGLDASTVAGRFVCPTAPLRLLHPALLTTLVYRFGPAGAAGQPRPDRVLANGQCLAARRLDLLEAGGFAPVAGHLTDDVALARHLARRGWRLALLDGTGLLRVRMHTGAADAWRNWGRSLPMPDVTTPAARLLDAWTLVATLGLPLPRLLRGRADALDLALLALRAGTLVGTARAYEQTGPAYWLSPLADLPAVARVLWGAVRPGRTWRGRTYPTPA